MIVGVGTDLVAVARIAEVLSRQPVRFPRRVLVDVEIEAFRAASDPARWLAKRFAAKEAVAKAFGTGIGAKLSFKDIVVGRSPAGAPLLTFRGDGVRLAAARGVVGAHLSLSDERDYAMAFVVLEGRG